MSAIPANAIARAAAAIVAERAARRGVVETLAALGRERRAGAYRDAMAALDAAGFGELLEALRAAEVLILAAGFGTGHAAGLVIAAIMKAERP